MSAVESRIDDVEVAGKPLISRSSVLIIGGLLIGLTMSNAVHAGIRSQVFLAGAFGVVAYIGLNCVANVRRKKAIERKHEEKLSQLEARVDQHIH
jgi:hypothetical protein